MRTSWLTTTSSRKTGGDTGAGGVEVAAACGELLVVSVVEPVETVVVPTVCGTAAGYEGNRGSRSRGIMRSHESMPAKVSRYVVTESMKNGLCAFPPEADPPPAEATPAILPTAFTLRRKMSGADSGREEKMLSDVDEDAVYKRRTVRGASGRLTDCSIAWSKTAPEPEICSRSSTNIGIGTLSITAGRGGAAKCV